MREYHVLVYKGYNWPQDSDDDTWILGVFTNKELAMEKMKEVKSLDTSKVHITQCKGNDLIDDPDEESRRYIVGESNPSVYCLVHYISMFGSSIKTVKYVSDDMTEIKRVALESGENCCEFLYYELVLNEVDEYAEEIRLPLKENLVPDKFKKTLSKHTQID